MNLRAGNSVIPISSEWCFSQLWWIESWLRCCALPALQVFDTLAILALVPLFDQILYPLLKKYKFNMSMLSKIGKLLLLLIFDPSWLSLSPWLQELASFVLWWACLSQPQWNISVFNMPLQVPSIVFPFPRTLLIWLFFISFVFKMEIFLIYPPKTTLPHAKTWMTTILVCIKRYLICWIATTVFNTIVMG